MRWTFSNVLVEQSQSKLAILIRVGDKAVRLQTNVNSFVLELCLCYTMAGLSLAFHPR